MSRVVLLLVALFFAAGLYGQANDGTFADPSREKIEEEDEDGEDTDESGERGIESFTSFLDGEPEEPGELEIEIAGGAYETPEAERGAAMEVELEYTPELNGWFWRNLRVSFGIEWERESAPNPNAVSFREFAFVQAGRADAGAASSNLIAELQDYLLLRPYVQQYYQAAGDAAGLRDVGLFQGGRSLGGARSVDAIAALLSAPFPLHSRADLLQYHQLRLLAGQPEARDESVRAGRYESASRSAKNETNLEFGWTQRWFEESDAPGFMISTVAGLSIAAGDDGESVGEFALVFAKTLGPGRVYVNLGGAGPLDDDIEAGERAQHYTGRLGYRWEPSKELAILFGVVHEGPREIEGESATLGELSVQWEVGDELYVGPGIFFGLDGREDTPRWGAGLSIVF